MAKIFKHLRHRFDALRWRQRDLTDRLLFSPWRERRLVARLRATLPPLSTLPAKRLLLDVSVISRHDAGTGIQRVVRSLRERLPDAIRPDVTITHALVPHMRAGYVDPAGAPLEGDNQTLFFGLDFATDAIHHAQDQLLALRRSGTAMWFLVHDILPMSHPHWFTYPSRLKYRRWMRVCAALADGFLCVSPEVAGQLETVMTTRYGRRDLPEIVTITPGSDIAPDTMPGDIVHLPQAPGLDATAFGQAVLIVGTLEPRKGHADALAAFELLWREGQAISLVLIGKPGWNTLELQKTIRTHAQHGRLLFWFDNADDQALHAAYRHCRLTLVPSLAEGYGLPLDEALALGSRVLARDIPVFRRHPSDQLDYFPIHADARTLAACVLKAVQAPPFPPEHVILPPDWGKAAREVAAIFNCDRN